MEDRQPCREDPGSLGGNRRVQDTFVGRGAELDLLRQRIDELISGSGGLVLISGEPGIGKTRLVEQAAVYARARAVHVVWGRSWEGEGAPAFWPWMQIIRSFGNDGTSDSWLPALGGGATDIARAIPELREFLPALNLPAVPAESDQARFRFFDSFGSFLKRLSVSEPLLLVLDDLHLADHASLLLLQFLSTTIADAAVLVTGTYRDVNLKPDQPLCEVLGVVSRTRTTDRIALPGLRHSDIRLFLRSAIGSEPSDALVQALLERTGGNPFFLCEVVSLLARRTDLSRSKGSEVWTTAPLTVREVIGKHLQSVTPACAAALAFSAVNGREFGAELIANAMDISPREFCRILDEAVASQIAEHRGTTRYRFRHSLVRETIYESLSGTARAKIHLSIANALERQVDYPNLAALAYHFLMSLPHGSPHKALEYAVLAGAEASAHLAYEEAVVHYERALELRRSAVAAKSRCDLLLLLGEAQARAGVWLESRSTYARAAEDARLMGSAEHFAQAAIGFKGMMGATTPVDTEAVALLRESVGLLGSRDSGLLVQVLSALGQCLYFADLPLETAEYAERAVAAAHRVGSEELVLIALEARIMSLWRLSSLDSAFGVATELLDRALHVGNKDIAFNAHLYRNYCFLARGDVIASDTEIARAQRLANETRNVRHSWQIPMIRAGRALARGEFEESERLSDTARTLGERVHDSSPSHNYMVQIFQRARLRGDFTGLDAAVGLAQERYPELGGYRAARTLLLARQGEVGSARTILSGFAGNGFGEVPMDILALWILTMLAEAAVLCGETRCGAMLYRKLQPFHEHNTVMGWGSAYDGPVSHYLGLLAASLGDRAEADRYFEHSLRVNAIAESGPLLARTRLSYAETLLREGETRDARKGVELLREAISAFEVYGMSVYLEQARDLLAGVSSFYGCPSPAVPEEPAGDGIGSNASKKLEGEDGCVFRREGSFWTIAFDGRVLRLQHSRGLAMLYVLLQRPDTEVHVLDLVSVVDGGHGWEGAEGHKKRGRPRSATDAMRGDAGPLIDARARDEYRRRAKELRSELDEAERFNDIGRSDRLRAEIEQLVKELSRAYGKHGPRRAAAASERARINVRNNLSNALKLLKPSNDPLWRHLNGALRTGTFCSYQPERPIPWLF